MCKKFFLGFISVACCTLLIIGSTVCAIDPFNHYHANKDMTKIIYQMPYYQNIGIAKHTEYDTLITGTSMTQNFRANHFDEKFNCKAIRLSFDGGVLSDFCTLLRSATESNCNLKRVYFGLDNYIITEDSDLLNQTERIPEYLIDNNHFNDVRYLLNKDVIFKYMRTYFSYKLSDTYNFYEMHAWDNESTTFDEDTVLKEYTMPISSDMIEKESYHSAARNAIDRIGTLIKENPNVEFVLFAPPYSILYWHTQLTEGKLDATLSAMQLTYGKLLKYENVKLFYFQNISEMITNLDNYKDATHYRSSYNEYMLDCFASGEHEITKNNYTHVLDEMKHFAENYDYDNIFA